MEEFLDDDSDPDADFEGDKITVIGSALYQPIADLIGKLALRKSKAPNAIGVGNFENGYSVSIIILMVLVFESYVTRVYFLHSQKSDDIPQREPSTLKYLQSREKSFPYADALTEVYIVRDAIAHAHLWQENYLVRQGFTEITKRDLFEGYGDRKMRALVDPSIGLTKHLGLNVLPTSIGLREVVVIFKVIADIMEYLVKCEMIERAAVRGQVIYGGKHQQFWSLYADLVQIGASLD